MTEAWAGVALGEVCKVVSGATPKTSNDAFWGGEILWATPKDLSGLSGKFISSTPRTLTEAGLKSCAATVLPPGSLLLSSRAPIGLVAINTVPIATNQGFKSLVPNPAIVDVSYLYWWAATHGRLLRSLGRGATFKEISKSITESVKIPLPPLEEQRRIAAILDQADELRIKRRASLTLLDSLTESIFLDMFGDPSVNPKGYSRCPLGALAVKFSDGPFGSNLKSAHYVPAGVRVIRLQNIGVGRFIDDDAAFISEGHFAKLKKHECLPSDVLVGTLGDPNLRACIQPSWLPRALNKADCVQIRPDPEVATSAWMSTLLNSRSVERMATGLVAGQTRSRISMGRLRTLEVPVPSVNEQRRFSDIALTANSEYQRMHGSERRLDELFASLQQRAFSGNL